MIPDGAPSSRKRSFLDWLYVFLSGLCMGAADVVPGISGGTVAFIIGVYPELLESLKSLNAHNLLLLASLKFKQFNQAVNWKFLAVLISGITVSFLSLAELFRSILGDETQRVYLYAGFTGLIVASIWFCARQLSSWHPKYFFGLLIGAIIAYFLSSSLFVKSSDQVLYRVPIALTPPTSADNYQNGFLLDVPEPIVGAMLTKGIISPETWIKSENVLQEIQVKDLPPFQAHGGFDLWLMVCGAIAISAMLLPGISGSYLLTILGVYGVVIAALADFIAGIRLGLFEEEAFFILASMMVGICIGATLFSRVVSWLLRFYHDSTIAVLTGFMIGAMGSVWPFWSYGYAYDPLKLERGAQLYVVEPIFPDLSSPLFFKSCFLALAGFSLVFILEFMASKGGHRGNQPT